MEITIFHFLFKNCKIIKELLFLLLSFDFLFLTNQFDITIQGINFKIVEVYLFCKVITIINCINFAFFLSMYKIYVPVVETKQ